MKKQVLLGACLALGALAGDAGAALVYDYQGTVLLGPGGLAGKSLHATFVIDEDVSGVTRVGAQGRFYPFAVLSASVTIDGTLTFDALPFGSFNPAQDYMLPLNRNYVQVRNNVDDPNAVPNFNAVNVQITAGGTVAGITPSSLFLNVVDFPPYQMTSLDIPASLDGFAPVGGFGNDSVVFGMGYCTTSICSTITSGNGVLHVSELLPEPVPLPTSAPLLLAPLAVLWSRRRRQG